MESACARTERWRGERREPAHAPVDADGAGLDDSKMLGDRPENSDNEARQAAKRPKLHAEWGEHEPARRQETTTRRHGRRR